MNLVNFLAAGNPRRLRDLDDNFGKLNAFHNIAASGDVTTSTATANAAFAQAVTDIGSSGGLINPKGSLVDFSAVSIPNAVLVWDMAAQRLITSNVAVGKSTQASGGHLLVRDSRPNQGTRMHVEPRGYVVGVTSKFDLMFDPYEDDGVNYRILNFYTKTYDPADASTTQGNNGIAVMGVKGVGANFGIWPALHIGFSDDGAGGAVPLKMYYFDTSDTSWRTPFRGAWRAGVSVTSGDYMTASNKLYQSGTTATTGATIPSHTSGAASDGTVSWTFIRDFAAASGSIKGCVVIGDRDDLPKFGNPTQRLQIAKQVGLWNGVKFQFMDNTGAVVWNLYPKDNTDNVYLETLDGLKRLRLAAASQFIQIDQLAFASTGTSDTSLSATPSVRGVRVLTFGNASATTVTSFTNAIPNQEFYVRSGNNNTTLQHNASIRLIGGVNKTPGTDDVLHFLMNSAGTVAVQVI